MDDYEGDPSEDYEDFEEEEVEEDLFYEEDSDDEFEEKDEFSDEFEDGEDVESDGSEEDGDEEEPDITSFGSTREIFKSGLFTAEERRLEYRRRGKSPSGVINGEYNDTYLEDGAMYSDSDRDWDADA